jgi:hypothetical protein
LLPTVSASAASASASAAATAASAAIHRCLSSPLVLYHQKRN